METMSNLAERENQILKAKCNKLLDVIEELQTEKDKLEETLLLKKENAKEQKSFEEKDALYLYMESLRRVMKSIVENAAFIEYSNQSKNSLLYNKIEKDVFEDYIEENALIDKKDFIDLSVKMQFLKSEYNRKCIYNSDSIRVYFVAKAVMELIYTKVQQED